MRTSATVQNTYIVCMIEDFTHSSNVEIISLLCTLYAKGPIIDPWCAPLDSLRYSLVVGPNFTL